MSKFMFQLARKEADMGVPCAIHWLLHLQSDVGSGSTVELQKFVKRPAAVPGRSWEPPLLSGARHHVIKGMSLLRRAFIGRAWVVSRALPRPEEGVASCPQRLQCLGLDHAGRPAAWPPLLNRLRASSLLINLQPAAAHLEDPAQPQHGDRRPTGHEFLQQQD
ncbi:hypothetical protein SNOG_09832 [Parastagonospora nodorum SN15]|uniref:Uncharacterized protein n=1 Tax=Phaeosphaeria nodorum (strain SN15 / ATCC MYA-4574 / FGSC 10173) TaxID=321614 RepID=Q0UEI2_PHANO|nr:hypothetical protein SNOG_09832 [Parastagonospora nodorum SN15]EAT83097.1 hypothetical protein SNOG_09832 [Parastagonospora nodorum SN15]